MGLTEELDRMAERILEEEIEECLSGKKPVPQWLKDSLERISKEESESVDEGVDSGQEY